MTQSTLLTIVIIAAAIIYICYKQCVQQLVSNRDFLLPIIGAIYFAIIVINGQVGMDSIVFVVVGGVVGILTGLMSGQVVRVWRDHNTGMVYQRGGWSYVMVLLGLMAARIIIYIVLRYGGVVAGFGPINFAFIALALGNYLGRSINVHLRSQRLLPQVA